MLRRSPHTRFTLLLAILTVPAARDDLRNPMSAEAPHPSRSVIEGVRDVPARMVHLPPEPRPWDTSARGLEEAVALGRGHVTVAFKEPGSARLTSWIGSERGRREAV
jgi:hypothetical protein